MDKSDYIPSPYDTSNISLPDGLETLVEALAKNVHEVWASGRLEDGWVLGEERNDALKQHPCLIPYEELSEEEKDYAKNILPLPVDQRYNKDDMKIIIDEIKKLEGMI